MPLFNALFSECCRRVEQGQLAPASIGRQQRVINEQIRSDSIQWLEPGQSAASDEYLQQMDALRQQLNQHLFLGLVDFECHFAAYPAGAFYQRHLDRFRDDDRRAISVVSFLNEHWQPEDGGALRLHLSEHEVRDIYPERGTMVIFRSADIAHEVCVTQRQRLSVTGWFRQRGGLF